MYDRYINMYNLSVCIGKKKNKLKKKLYKVYINDDSVLTLTYFTARSNWVICTFEWEKL